VLLHAMLCMCTLSSHHERVMQYLQCVLIVVYVSSLPNLGLKIIDIIL
jgi:hypothetical protein